MSDIRVSGHLWCSTFHEASCKILTATAMISLSPTMNWIRRPYSVFIPLTWKNHIYINIWMETNWISVPEIFRHTFSLFKSWLCSSYSMKGRHWREQYERERWVYPKHQSQKLRKCTHIRDFFGIGFPAGIFFGTANSKKREIREIQPIPCKHHGIYWVLHYNIECREQTRVVSPWCLMVQHSPQSTWQAVLHFAI